MDTIKMANDELEDGGSFEQETQSQHTSSFQPEVTAAASSSFGHTSERIDYLSLFFEVSYDEFEQIRYRFTMLQESLSEAGVWNKAPTFHCHGASATGLRKYTIEWYGVTAHAMLAILPESFYSNISRLDIRREEPKIRPELIQGLVNYVDEFGRGGRNTVVYNTREREKKNGRHSGGVGFALGSHKSTNRMSVYKRAKENPAIEVQLSGRSCVSIIDNAILCMDDTEQDFLSCILSNADSRFTAQAALAGFKSYQDMVHYLSTGDVTPHNVQSDVRANIEAQLDKLSHIERLKLVDALLRQAKFDFINQETPLD